MPRCTARSAQFISQGGRNSPSGRCGSPSRSPLTPTKRSTYAYQGARSAYRIGQSTPCPSRRFASKSRSLQRDPAPNERAPAQLIATDPAEGLGVGRDVGVLPITYEEMPRRLGERVVLALDRVVPLVQRRLAAPAVRQLPGLERLGHIAGAVLDVPTAFDDEGPQALLGELFG